MNLLTWTRTRDGEHNGRPTYEYSAQSHGRKYHIVYAIDRGGSFGYTACKPDADRKLGESPYLTERYGIIWAGTLVNCKAACEKIEKDMRYGK